MSAYQQNFSASEEEEHAKLELNNCEAEYKDSHETLAYKTAELDQTYIALVDLELDHDNIRKEGNIIEYEKKTEIPHTNTLYQERVNNLRDKLEDHRITLRNTCKVVQPTQKGMTQLHYRTVNARDFISEMHDKYSHYMDEKIINTMLNKLEYTLKIASSKLEKL